MLILGICLPATAFAQPLINENFEYTVGDSLDKAGYPWQIHSGNPTNRLKVISGNLTYATYPSSGIGDMTEVVTTGEDGHRDFTTKNSGSVYASFLGNVTSATTGPVGDYFFHLGRHTTSGAFDTGFYARVYVRKDNTSGNIYFGLTKQSISSTGTIEYPTWTSSSYSLNTTYLIVVRYTFNPSTVDDVVSLWVNPACDPQPSPDIPVGYATSKADATDLAAVALRQGGATLMPTVQVDGIRVGTTWFDVRCGTGSCCYTDGTCAVTLSGDCVGVWTYAGVCDPNPCPQPGECCHADGSCTVTLQSACNAPATWTLGGDCDPNPCPPPGECCQHSGVCTVTLEADCTYPQAIWTLGGDCDPNPCPLPTGACCAENGDCTVTEELACEGVTWSIDVDCDPNPCDQPIGRCCALDGSCTVTLQDGCTEQGSVWSLGVCEPNTCPQPDGACCRPDGICVVTKLLDCPGGPSVWTMFGDCDPNECPQPDGACCNPNGACTVTKLLDCAWPTAWTMFDDCDPNNCPLPTGSCCDIYGICTVTEQLQCPPPSVWTMFGNCPPSFCPPEQGACCLDTGLCLLGAPGDCVGLGIYQGAGTSCTPNPCPAPVKTVCEVAEDDANGLALLVGQRVTVYGVALCNDDTWSKPPTSVILEFQMTAGGCCIDVFGEVAPPNVVTGDSVMVVGTVANYNGKTEIAGPIGSPPVVTVISSGHTVTPGLATTGVLATAGEPYESCLFTINCVSIVSGTWPVTRVDANIVINDGTGNVTMRLDKDTDCWTIPAPTSPFTVTGIGDQFDTSSPYTTGWQIKPRGPSDIGATCASGACCKLDGTCVPATPDGCASLGGTYRGDGTTCPPSPECPPAQGACCFHDGTCQFLSQAACLPLLGQWYGYGSVCLPNNPCAQPDGSCCYPDGSCEVMSNASCTVSGGTWTIDGVCVPNTCSDPQGVEGEELDSVLGVRAKPNPFAGSVSLRVAGPKATAARVLIFDAAGRLVRTAWNGMLNGRAFNVTWDGRDDSGRQAGTGIYMVRLESGSGSATGRLVKLR
jgi:hypothetical protein